MSSLKTETISLLVTFLFVICLIYVIRHKKNIRVLYHQLSVICHIKKKHYNKYISTCVY